MKMFCNGTLITISKREGEATCDFTGRKGAFLLELIEIDRLNLIIIIILCSGGASFALNKVYCLM